MYNRTIREGAGAWRLCLSVGRLDESVRQGPEETGPRLKEGGMARDTAPVTLPEDSYIFPVKQGHSRQRGVWRCHILNKTEAGPHALFPQFGGSGRQ
jgi:hypothetical protein